MRGRQVPFEVTDAVRALRRVEAAFFAPHEHKVGDLVQTPDFHADWAGRESAELTPCLVLDLCDDLGEKTGEAKDAGRPGMRVVHAEPQGIRVEWYERWYFEPYTGPRPDAH